MKPNTVSLLSIVFAGVGGWAAWWASLGNVPVVFWLVAAAGIQLRLLCNLMDGMLAVEGGLKSPSGELFNEIPDRIADVLVLAPLGYAGGCGWTIALGWSAAFGAAFTAYVRVLGATLTGKHDFCGPMAKPHRMAMATLGCLAMVVQEMAGASQPLLFWVLIAINAGIVLTLWRRTVRLARSLGKGKAANLAVGKSPGGD
jgi:phosphatidylglycerophosphate synthase